jgi:hypothetical protein
MGGGVSGGVSTERGVKMVRIEATVVDGATES